MYRMLFTDSSGTAFSAATQCSSLSPLGAQIPVPNSREKKKKKPESLYWITGSNYTIMGIHWLIFHSILFFFFLFRAASMAHTDSQARGLNWSCSCRPQTQPQPRQIQASSVTYTTAHSNTRSLTHWASPAIEPTSSWMLVGCCCTTRGTPTFPGILISRLSSFLSGCCCEIICQRLPFPWPLLGQPFPGVHGREHCWRGSGCCLAFPLLPLGFLSIWATEGFAEEQRFFFFFNLHPLNIHQVMDSTSTISWGNKNSLQPALCHRQSSRRLEGGVLPAMWSTCDFPRQSPALRADACQTRPR